MLKRRISVKGLTMLVLVCCCLMSVFFVQGAYAHSGNSYQRWHRDTQAPEIPSGLAAAGKTTTSITLSWSPSTDDTGVKGYILLKNGVKAGTTSKTTYKVGYLKSATQYTFTVKAFDFAGNFSDESAPLAVTTQGPKAPAVTGKPVVTSKTDSTVSLSWAAPKNSASVAGYAVFRDGVRVGETTGTTYEDSGLSGDTDYTYTVKSLNATGDESNPSPSITVTTCILISQDTEWTNTEPYMIKGGLIVAPGATLYITSGAVVKLYPGVGITVHGTVNISSTPAGTVFTSVNDPAYGGKGIRSSSDYWDSIVIAPGGFFTGDNIKVTYGDVLFDVQGFLSLLNSGISKADTLGITVAQEGVFSGMNVKISQCCNQKSCKGIYTEGIVNLNDSEISDCPGTGVVVAETGSFNSTATIIRNCDKGVDVQGSVSVAFCTISGCNYGLYFNSALQPFVSLNSFTQNKCYGIYNNSTAATMDGSNNYWGSAGGPSVYDAASGKWVGDGDRVSAGVIHSPWLDAVPTP